jgi:hypothetical protein
MNSTDANGRSLPLPNCALLDQGDSAAPGRAPAGQLSSSQLARSNRRHHHAAQIVARLCQSYARVTIIDAQWDSSRAFPRHAVAALDGITDAHVVARL